MPVLAVADTASTNQDTPVVINVLSNDTGAGLSVTGVTIDPTVGTAVVNPDNTVTFTPNASYDSLSVGDSAVGSFSYTVKDSTGASSTAGVNVTINGLNDAPVANPDAATVADGQSVTINVLGNDVDVDRLHILNVVGFTNPASGASLQLINGQFVYTADVTSFDSIPSGQHITDTFTYTIADDWGATSTTTVTVTVTGNAQPGETICGSTQDGGNHDQVIMGGAGNDVLGGGNGRDTIEGGGGSDTIAGGNGNDSLSGGAGNDVLIGGGNVCNCDDDGGDKHQVFTGPYAFMQYTGEGDGGKDTLDGGAGDDTLVGGHGPDRFIFGDGFGHDVIVDFDPHNDKMQISHNELGSYGDLMAHASQVGWNVVIGTDGGDDTITLWGVSLHDLKSSDFIFV